MTLPLTVWNNIRMILGIIPYKGIDDRPYCSGKNESNLLRVVTPQNLKDNAKKAEKL